jgi:hypothetical protein
MENSLVVLLKDITLSALFSKPIGSIVGLTVFTQLVPSNCKVCPGVAPEIITSFKLSKTASKAMFGVAPSPPVLVTEIPRPSVTVDT